MLYFYFGILMEIFINGIFCRKSIFVFFDDFWYRRKSLGIIKYGILGVYLIVKREDVIEYWGVKKVKLKY